MASSNNASSEDKKKLVYSIMQMLQRDLEKSNGDGDRQKGETLEVIIQCLSEVYEVQLESDANKYKSFAPLETLFQRAKGPLGSSPDNPMPIPTGGATPADMAAAEEFKRQGNEHMKSKEFEQAISAYASAIELNDEKSEYYCNRAAAFSKTGQHDRAIEDCTIALGLKEDYARAHGRLGFAYYQLGKHLEAKRAYKRAIELEPDNAGYKHNLESLERTLRENEHPPPSAPAPAPSSLANSSLATGPAPGNAAGFGSFGGMGQQPAFPGFGGLAPMGAGGQAANLGGLGGLPNMGGMDMGSLMNNPAFMNMATQMMSDPNMMNMATQLASQMSQSGANPMAGLMGNPGFFPPPPNQQQQQQQQQRQQQQQQQHLQFPPQQIKQANTQVVYNSHQLQLLNATAKQPAQPQSQQMVITSFNNNNQIPVTNCSPIVFSKVIEPSNTVSSPSSVTLQIQQTGIAQPKISEPHLMQKEGAQITLDTNNRPILSYSQVPSSLPQAPKALLTPNGICQMENVHIASNAWVKDSPGDIHAIPLLNTTLSPHFSFDPAFELGQRRRKKRAVFAPQVRRALEVAFEQNTRPSRRELEFLAGKLGLLFEEVRVWFCNKRQKERQQLQLSVNENPNGDTCGDSYNAFFDGSPPLQSVTPQHAFEDALHEHEFRVKDEFDSDCMLLPVRVSDKDLPDPGDLLMPTSIDSEFINPSKELNFTSVVKNSIA